MRLGILLPLLMLLLIAVLAVVTVVFARQQRRLQRRVEAAVPTGPAIQPVLTHGPELRMRAAPTGHIGTLARLLHVPFDLPDADVLPQAWVFTVATVAAIGAILASHYLVSWATAGFVGVVVWVLVVRNVFGWELGRYRARLLRQLPDAVQLVVSATRAGLPVSDAFRTIAQDMPAPTSNEFVRVNNEMALGISADEALLNLHRRTGVTEYAIFAVTIGVQARSGGRLAETIQNLAETVRERLTLAARARALAGEAKISAIIMGLMPIFGGALLSWERPGHLDPLLYDPRGQKMFIFGIVSLILGALTMRFLIRGATRD